MTENCSQTPEKSISDADELQSILRTLTTNQMRWVIARQETATDGEAATAIGLKPDTIYRWPETVKRAVELMAHDGVITALELRRRSLAKAMAVKVAGLDSGDEKIRQAVATEIIEGELGKAQENVNHKGGLNVLWTPHKPSTGQS